jgi:hypothetical protein
MDIRFGCKAPDKNKAERKRPAFEQHASGNGQDYIEKNGRTKADDPT